jgi:predicted metal-dependent hydrolase
MFQLKPSFRLKSGENEIDGVPVRVVRRRGRRINIRILDDGTVRLMVPHWWATLAQGMEFLAAKWDWVLDARARVLARPPAAPPIEASDLEVHLLERLLTELHTLWTARLNEPGVTWKLRRMKTLWGVCHFSKRQITYARMLALKPRELVEYVVVHELTHLKIHNHGPAFKALMDARLPNWRQLRRRLNARAAAGSAAEL